MIFFYPIFKLKSFSMALKQFNIQYTFYFVYIILYFKYKKVIPSD